ncbi:MAG: alpha/beta hydrolase [Legionellales bacterium]
MNSDDFRYMRHGKPLCGLQPSDLALIAPFDQRGSGTERALLLIHGLSSSPAVFRYLIPKLKQYDAIVCPLLPGHGQSVALFRRVKVSEWLETVRIACEDLCKHYTKVDILGFSLGGLLACELTKIYNLNHLYLLAPAFKLPINVPFNIKLAKVAQALGFRDLRNNAGNFLSNEHAEIAFRKFPLSAAVEMLEYQQAFKWVLPACPIDLFLGRHDNIIASEAVEALFTPLANTHIHWLENSAHVLPLDNDLDAIVECINLKETVYCIE